MGENVKELTAYCGLYCGDCIRYKSRAAELSKDLLDEFKNTQFDEYAEYKSSPAKQFDPVDILKNYEICCQVLDAVIDLQCNNPCRVGGGCSGFSCEILACCLNKNLEGCWECDIYESCSKFEPLKACHSDRPQKHLRMINEFGLDNWARHRYKPYMWQQDDNGNS